MRYLLRCLAMCIDYRGEFQLHTCPFYGMGVASCVCRRLPRFQADESCRSLTDEKIFLNEFLQKIDGYQSRKAAINNP